MAANSNRTDAWIDVRRQLHSIVDTLAQAHMGSGRRLLVPEPGLSAECCYMEAFRLLHGEVDGALSVLQRLADEVDRLTPRARPLEAVIAEIVAAGHADISLERMPWN